MYRYDPGVEWSWLDEWACALVAHFKPQHVSEVSIMELGSKLPRLAGYDFDLPQCLRCGRRVERVIVNTLMFEYVVFIDCHGQRERREMTGQELVAALSKFGWHAPIQIYKRLFYPAFDPKPSGFMTNADR